MKFLMPDNVLYEYFDIKQQQQGEPMRFINIILTLMICLPVFSAEKDDIGTLESIPEEYRGIFVVTSISTQDYSFKVPVNNHELLRLTALTAQRGGGNIAVDAVYTYKIKVSDDKDEKEYFHYTHITWKNSDIYWRFYKVGNKLFLTTYRNAPADEDGKITGKAEILDTYSGYFAK